MSIRKRTWTTNGVEHSGWQADYLDAQGKRRRKTFAKKKDADAFLVKAKGEVRDGVHVPDSETITVAEAGKLWLASCVAAGLERTTVDQYERHLRLHIMPFIGTVKLNKLSVPRINQFQVDLREAGRSPAMVKRVTVSLGSIIGEAQGAGLTVRNPVHEKKRTRSRKNDPDRRSKPKLRVGVDIPSPAEIKVFIAQLSGRWRPLFLTAIFTGMRSSELRGLIWANVDLDGKTIHVRQRADAYNDIGNPKSEDSARSLPIPPIVANTLREWKLVCPRRDTGRKGEAGEPIRELHLVFPTNTGNVEDRRNIARRGLIPMMIAAGLATDTGEVDENGKAIFEAKYSGLHALRHFYASWCINPVSAGGLGLLPKAVQDRLGHSTIAMTMDTYGHLFPADDDADLMAQAERSLLG